MNLLVDTNVLLVHAVGAYDLRKLGRVSLGLLDPQEEYRRVSLLVSSAKRLATTLVVLGEFANLAEKRLRLSDEQFLAMVEAYREFLEKLEIVAVSKDEMLDSAALRFGLPDCSLYEASRKEGLQVLTRDDKLRGLLEKRGLTPFPFYDFLFRDP